jgi:nitrite reductase/ring-hydroxylating ferredoxin subunit
MKMDKKTWMVWLVAAIVVILGGALIAGAEERIEIRVEAENDVVSVDVNGVTEVIRLDDLADGESRTFDVGDHELIVTRIGDELKITSDGHGFGSFGEMHETMVWVGDGGEKIEIDGDAAFGGERVIVMNVGDCEGEDCEHAAKAYRIHVDGDEVLLDEDGNVDLETIIATHGGHPGHGAVFISKDGNVHHPGPIAIDQWRSDMVTYRCEETGSTLMVKKDDAYEDVYICPATGCVMTKVEAPNVQVIKIIKKVEIDEEE